MRSVKNELFNVFDHNTTDCVIDSKKRQSCKKCRFEKCISVGMRISFVKTQFDHCQRMLAYQKNIPKSLKNVFLKDECQILDDMFKIFTETNHKYTFEVVSLKYSYVFKVFICIQMYFT